MRAVCDLVLSAGQRWGRRRAIAAPLLQHETCCGVRGEEGQGNREKGPATGQSVVGSFTRFLPPTDTKPLKET